MKPPATDNCFYTDSRQVSRLVAPTMEPNKILEQEIGPAFSKYRQQWDAARNFTLKLSFPLHVDYEMKFQCNLSCPMCLMSLNPTERLAFGDPQHELSPEKVLELVAYGAKRGQKAMGFGGLWEPLLSPDLPEVIAGARALGLVDLMLNTNGLLLTEKISRAILSSGLTRLMVSLDAATAKTYAQMRSGADFKTVTTNIETFLALRKSLGQKLPLLRLSFCRTEVNEAELPAFLERWEGKADFFSIQAYGRYPGPAPPGWAAHTVAQPAGRCAQPHKRLLVRHNGDELPCCDASGAGLVLGNIKNESLAEIWNGCKLATLRQSLTEDDLSTPIMVPCQECHAKFIPSA